MYHIKRLWKPKNNPNATNNVDEELLSVKKGETRYEHLSEITSFKNTIS